jgi:hypothetical protein
MGNLVFQATLGGQVNLVGTNTSSTFNINVPAVNGNLVTTGDTGTVTNTMLAGSIANAKLTNSSVTVGSTSIALGATSTTLDGVNIGGTTAGTGAFTTLTGSTSTTTPILKSASSLTLQTNGTTTAVTIDSSQNVTLNNVIPSGSTVPSNGMFLPASNTVGFSTATTERMRITSSNFLVNTASTFDVTSGAFTQLSGQCAVYNSGTTNTLMSFYNSSQSARVGYIGSSGNSTSYNSGSDYRLKENITNVSGAISKIQALRPVTFTWKISPQVGTITGFIAHELQNVYPEAVTGEKDAMCDDGITPNYQMVDQSKLVPLLTAAIQELTTRIVALEAK